MNLEQARQSYLTAIKNSILADQRGYGPDIDKAWKFVEEARAAMTEAFKATPDAKSWL